MSLRLHTNTLLKVVYHKGGIHSPSCMGPIMICMTKEEGTYLSFIYYLLREVPSLSQTVNLAFAVPQLQGCRMLLPCFVTCIATGTSRLNWRNWGFLNLSIAKFAVTVMCKVAICPGQILNSNSMNQWRPCWENGIHTKVKKEEVPHNLLVISGNPRWKMWESG